jgi:hypothetical protein
LPGYELKDLKYTVVVPRSRGFRKGSGRGKRVGAVADGFSIVTNFFHDIGLQRNVDKKLEKMEPDIKKAMGNHTGILVVVQYQQWEADNPDFPRPELLSIIIGPAASNTPSAIRRWEQKCKLMQGPDKGKVVSDNYLWFTEDKSKKDDLKKSEVLKKKE